MLEPFANAIRLLLDPIFLFIILFSVPLGIIVGVLPGIGATVGVTVLLPLTFGMAPIMGITMLLAVYCGAFYGGAISAILINTPGTPAAICTILDGYPMAIKGEGEVALSTSVWASFVGGMISVVLLSFTAPLLAEVALKFSYTEYFAISFFGLIMVVFTTGRGEFLKGFMMAILGLFLSTIGQDKMSIIQRFTFGILELTRGLQLLPILVGLFAISQALILTEMQIKRLDMKMFGKSRRWLIGLRSLSAAKNTLIKSSIIGTIVGAIPGTGAAVASFVAYTEAKRSSKTPEKFGTGEVEGIVASESANNGVTGGALIPLLTLGIPGDPITAVMLGAFLVHGLFPGPALFIQHTDFVYAIFVAMGVIYVFMLFYGVFAARLFAMVLKLHESILAPAILVICFVGAYAMNSSLFDVGIATIFGVVGYILTKFRFPLPPIILGLILGPIAEEGLRQSLIKSDGCWAIFFTKPISAIFLGLAGLVIFHHIYTLWKASKKTFGNP
jgi:putative tricarboxylic transport membrane protein